MKNLFLYLEHEFHNLVGLLIHGETIDEKWERDRRKFEAELRSIYSKNYASSELPFDLSKLSIYGVIKLKHLLDFNNNFDIERIARDIKYEVFELIVHKFQEERNNFGLRQYYTKSEK